MAAKVGIDRGYNRSLADKAALKKFTKDIEEGALEVFPVTFSMVHEHIDGETAKPHMRTVVILKDAITATLDVDMELFNTLPEFDTDKGGYVQDRDGEGKRG